MTNVTLLEDPAQAALRRERVFNERADCFSENDAWLILFSKAYFTVSLQPTLSSFRK
jgi:hypothetical protein